MSTPVPGNRALPRGSVMDPVYLSGKHSFPVKFHVSSRKAGAISGPELPVGGERTQFPQIHEDFVIIVLCTEAPVQRGFTWLTGHPSVPSALPGV